MNKNLFLGLLSSLALFGCNQKIKENEISVPPEPEKTITKVTVDMSFFGDIFWGRRMQTWSEASELKEAYPFSGLDTFEKQSTDNWIGNLECPSTTTEVSQFQQEKHLRFNCRTSYLPHAAKYFDVFSLANNHTDNVNGQAGLDETRANLDTHNIQHFGHFDNAVHEDICKIMSMKAKVEYSDSSSELMVMPLALCGYHNLYKLPTEEAIAVINQYAQHLPTFVMPHQGREYISRADGLQKKTFRKMIDSGADAVIGGHTHSVIDTELYNGKLIAYSIGNFIFDQQGTEMKRTGMVLHATLNFDVNDVKLLLGMDCGKYQDDCIFALKEGNFPKPDFELQWDAEISDNSNRLTKKADPTVTQRILNNAKWSETMNAFNELYN